MEANTPHIVIEGMEDIIAKDLQKHQDILERTKQELLSWRQARSHEIAKKKYYVKNVNNPKFKKDSMEKAIEQIKLNIRHFSDKIKLAEEKIKFETNIVDTLAAQLEEQNVAVKALNKFKKQNGPSDGLRK